MTVSFQSLQDYAVLVSVSAQDDIVAPGKAHTRSARSLSSFGKFALETVQMSVWLNTDRSRPWRVECRPLPFSIPLFLQAINAVMLWPVHDQKVPQASEHLCPTRVHIRCNVCCACQSVCPFIPTEFGVPRTADPQKSLQPKTVHGCVPVGAAHSKLCRRFIESGRMMAGVICASRWEASHCIVPVTASTSLFLQATGRKT